MAGSCSNNWLVHLLHVCGEGSSHSEKGLGLWGEKSTSVDEGKREEGCVSGTGCGHVVSINVCPTH